MLRRHDLRCTLVCTVDHNINLHEVGRVLRFGLERPIVRGVSFQLATYCGRHLDPADLEKRATMPDVVKAIVAQTDGLVAESDFYPLPCAHPNCHMMCYLYRGGETPVPINRLIDVRKHMDLIANSIVYTPARARLLVVALSRRGGRLRLRSQRLRQRRAGSVAPGVPSTTSWSRRWPRSSTATDVFRVTLTAFLDVHNFDTRRVMKCCLAHLLPSGHVVPFCAYNTLYRDGFVPLPPLADVERQKQSLALVTP